MILKGVEKWNIDLSNSYLIGDRFKDIDAGEKVNCKTIFMDYDYHERKPAKSTYRFKNFRTMINEIIKNSLIANKFKNTKIFADGANFSEMILLSKTNYIKGLTTNPSLMRKNGINGYPLFAKKILKEIKKKPISFEAFFLTT